MTNNGRGCTRPYLFGAARARHHTRYPHYCRIGIGPQTAPRASVRSWQLRRDCVTISGEGERCDDATDGPKRRTRDGGLVDGRLDCKSAVERRTWGERVTKWLVANR